MKYTVYKIYQIVILERKRKLNWIHLIMQQTGVNTQALAKKVN